MIVMWFQNLAHLRSMSFVELIWICMSVLCYERILCLLHVCVLISYAVWVLMELATEADAAI